MTRIVSADSVLCCSQDAKRTVSQSIANGLAATLTLGEFRTAQVPRVHCDVSSTSRVEADFVALDDNTSRLGLHSVAYGLELRIKTQWSSRFVCAYIGGNPSSLIT